MATGVGRPRMPSHGRIARWRATKAFGINRRNSNYQPMRSPCYCAHQGRAGGGFRSDLSREEHQDTGVIAIAAYSSLAGSAEFLLRAPWRASGPAGGCKS